jgi:hypothetical protein
MGGQAAARAGGYGLRVLTFGRPPSSPPACALGQIVRDPTVIVLTVAGCAARVIYGLRESLPPVGDQLQYDALAADFDAWWASSDAIRTPGYPLFVSLVSNLGGHDAVRLAQAVILSGACLLLAATAARAAVLAAGRATAAIAAVYPPLLGFPALILTDALAASLLVAAVFFVLESRWSRVPPRLVAGASVALAAGILVRPTLVIAAPPLALVALIWAPSGRFGLGKTAVALLVPALAVFAPWVARNVDRFGEPAPLSRSDASRLAVAAVHLPIYKAGGRYGAYYRSAHFFSNNGVPGGPLTVYQATGRDPWTILAENLRERPLEQASASLFWMRELWLVAFDDHAQYARPPTLPYELILGVHALLVISAGAGLLLCFRNPAVQLTWLLAVVMTLPFLVLLPEPRYAVPMAMLLMVPAGLAITRFVRPASADGGEAGPAAP